MEEDQILFFTPIEIRDIVTSKVKWKYKDYDNVIMDNLRHKSIVKNVLPIRYQ